MAVRLARRSVFWKPIKGNQVVFYRMDFKHGGLCKVFVKRDNVNVLRMVCKSLGISWKFFCRTFFYT